MRVKEVSVRLHVDRELSSERKLYTPADAVGLIWEEINDLDRECIYILNMRTSGAVINCHKAGLGTGNGTYFGMKEILRAAILSGAESIIMIHNHPSGSLIPSKEDCKSADQLIKACKLLGINFLDSIIIGPKGGSYYSLKEHGEIPNDKICYAAFPEQLKFQKTKLTMDTEIPSEEQERE